MKTLQPYFISYFLPLLRFVSVCVCVHTFATTHSYNQFFRDVTKGIYWLLLLFFCASFQHAEPLTEQQEAAARSIADLQIKMIVQDFFSLESEMEKQTWQTGPLNASQLHLKGPHMTPHGATQIYTSNKNRLVHLSRRDGKNTRLR